MTAVPVIDISAYRGRLAEEIDRTCREIGFMVIEGQRKRLSTVSQRDWAGRDADGLSPPVYAKKDRLPQSRPVH